MGRVGELDGVRGLAIAAVVVAHTAGPEWGSLGGAGVTVFFVLSGYLITGLLLEEQARTGTVSLTAFWARRARRLLPALLVTLLAVMALSPLMPGSTWWSWEYLLPVGLYYGNWWTIGHEPMGALSATWSLAVEEQFYLIWPVLMLAARRRWRSTVAVLAGASLVARFLLVPDIGRIYMGTDTVGFALLIGALLASTSRCSRPALASASLAFCAVPALMSPSMFVVLGVPAVAVPAAAAVRYSPGTAWLRMPVLRWLGLRSYAIYLAHVPVLVALRDYLHLGPLLVAALGVPTSLVLAELSWRFVEGPWRTRGSAPRPAVAERGARARVQGVRASVGPELPTSRPARERG